MLKKTLSKITTNTKTITNESTKKDSFVSDKKNINLIINEFERINIKKRLTNSENIYIKEKSLKNESSSSEEYSIITEYNEYSIFNTLDENQLKQNNDDKQIYNYLIRNYKTRKNVEEFINFFYPEGFKENPYINEIDFYLIGVFEDLAYYPIWMSDDLLGFKYIK